jgi:hypothetical protein
MLQQVWTAGWPLSTNALLGLILVITGCSGGGDPAFSAEGSAVGESVVSGAFPQVNDVIFTLVPDGSGGVFAGGQFNLVGQLPRQRLAHILANGTVDASWAPAADGPVTALLLQNQTLHIGGNFFSLNGVERWRLAAVDHVTAELRPWNPKVGTANLVNVLVPSGPLVYVGGIFELLNALIVPGSGLRGEARRNVGAVDATTGVATPWNPNIFEGEVKALAVSGSVVYVGGSFEQVGLVGQEAIRFNVAAFDEGSGLVTPWNPSVRGVNGDVVSALHVSDAVIYVGGRFDEVGGQPRQNLAALDRASGVATSWQLPTNDTVLTFHDDGRRLYVGGLFTMMGGQTRERLAAIDKTSGRLTSWAPDANGPVRTITVSGGQVFVGGDFTTMNGQPRSRLAVLDPETGLLVDD